MADSVNLATQEARLHRQALDDLDRHASDEALLEEDLELLALRLLGYPEEIKVLIRLAFRRMGAAPGTNYMRAGQDVLDLIAERLDLLRHFQALLARVVSIGGPTLKSAPAIQGAIEELETARAKMDTHWPWFQQADHDAALEDHKKGELLTADEAFARIRQARQRR